MGRWKNWSRNIGFVSAKSSIEKHQESIRRLPNHVQIVEVGASGVGKTEIIKALFGHNGDLESLKTSSRSSETRECTEYIISTESKDGESNPADWVSLGIVDTPGLEDTDGIKQDARNLACIQKFLQQSLQNTNTLDKLPNLVLLVMRGDGTRDIGPDSLLSKCISTYLNPYMGLTGDGKNVIIVLTHAINITLTGDWTAEAATKVDDIKKFVRQRTDWDIPVVLLENMPPRQFMPTVKVWTQFPNGTLQPLNLFYEIIALMERQKDIYGSLIINKLFSRRKEDSRITVTKGCSVYATLKSSGEAMTEQEDRLLQILKKGDHSRLGSQHRDTVQRKEEDQEGPMSEPQSGTQEEKEDVVDVTTKAMHNISIGGNVPNVSPPATTSICLGKAYDIEEQEGGILHHRILKREKVEKHMACEMSTQRKKKRLHDTNKTELFNTLRGKGSLMGGSLATGSHESSSTRDVQVGLESFVFKVCLQEETIRGKLLDNLFLEENFSDGFKAEVTKIPKKYKRDKKNNRDKFKRFFKHWGQGFVIGCHRGGEVYFRLTHERNQDSGLGQQESSASLGGAVTKDMVPVQWQRALQVLEGADGNLSRTNSSDGMNSTLKYDLEFRGGNVGVSTLEGWVGSLHQAMVPLILSVNRDVMLHHDYIGRLDFVDKAKERARAVKDAYEDMYVPDRQEIGRQVEDSFFTKTYKWFTRK